MFHQYRLSNGIQVISEVMPDRRTVSMGVFIKVGSADEKKEENGISHLIEHMLFKGTGRYSAKDIADITVRLGDDVNAFTSKECTSLYGMTISEKLPELVDLFSEMLTGFCVNPKELAKEKQVVLDEIDMYADSPEDMVHELLQKRVWREDSLGFLISGSKSTVRGFSEKQLSEYYKRYYYGENMLISIAGGYEEESVLRLLEKSFSNILKMPHNPQLCAKGVKEKMFKNLRLEPYYKAYPLKETGIDSQKEDKQVSYIRSFVTSQRDIEQLHMNLAFPGIVVSDERRFAYSILNSAFGGSNTSRLFQKIREEEGMAYSVYSYSSSYEKAGLFHIDVTSSPQKAVEVLNEIITLIREFTSCGISEKELEIHKQQIMTELIMNGESPKSRMDSNAKYALANSELYTVEEKAERIARVTCREIRELAEECMDLKKMSICVIGNLLEARVNSIKKIYESCKNNR